MSATINKPLLRRITGFAVWMLCAAAIAMSVAARAAESEVADDEAILKFGKSCERFEPDLEAKLETVKDSVKAQSDPAFPLTQPDYPATSRRLGESGVVLLAILVNEKGEVAAAKVQKSTGFPRLDAAARQEVGNWRLEPARVGGVRVCAWGLFAVTFKLTGDDYPSDDVAASAPNGETPYSALLKRTMELLRKHSLAPVDDGTAGRRVIALFAAAYDPDRMYLLASDLVELEATYAVALGAFEDVDAITAPMQVLKRRVGERLQYAAAHLEDGTRVEQRNANSRQSAPAKTVEELNARWNARMTAEMRAAAQAPLSREQLASRYSAFKVRIENMSPGQIIAQMINLRMKAADPHSLFFPTETTSYKVGRLFNLEQRGDYPEISSVRQDCLQKPADKPHSGDRLIASGSEPKRLSSALGQPLPDIYDDVTQIERNYLIIRDAGGRERTIELVCKDNEVSAVQTRIETVMRKGQRVPIGVLELRSFPLDQPNEKLEDTHAYELGTALQDIATAKPVGLVIDLRGNGGGALTTAIETAAFFSEAGPVVQLREREKDAEIMSSHPKDVHFDGPIVILIDRTTASGAELFAAALRDRGRALIAGEQSYGNGTAQQLYAPKRLPDTAKAASGSLVITIGFLYRANGASTQHAGVTPDLPLPSSTSPYDLRESDLPYALPAPPALATLVTSSAPFESLVEKVKAAHERRTQEKPRRGRVRPPAAGEDAWLEAAMQAVFDMAPGK